MRAASMAARAVTATVILSALAPAGERVRFSERCRERLPDPARYSLIIDHPAYFRQREAIEDPKGLPVPDDPSRLVAGIGKAPRRARPGAWPEPPAPAPPARRGALGPERMLLLVGLAVLLVAAACAPIVLLARGRSVPFGKS